MWSRGLSSSRWYRCSCPEHFCIEHPELEPAKMDLEAFGKELAERKEELMSEMQA
jgi:hypothetical protein